jgi:LmbE family N-acetylglucosaminyl deacetylase
MSDLFVEDNSLNYFERTTHLAIGAHQDDLEIMAVDGVLKCLHSDNLWFGGIVCTDGSGSARVGEYANFTDQQMKDVRNQEQIEAAKTGGYSFISQLGFSSSSVKQQDLQFLDVLEDLILKIKPKTIYVHNPFDKHPTHVAVFRAVLSILNKVKHIYRPDEFLGREVWRNLDWVDDTKKIVFDLSGQEEFILKILSSFKSQIAGGKRYDLATIGRMRANATYFDSHQVDSASLLSFAIDLMPLLNGISINEFTNQYLESFKESIFENY